MLTLIKVVVAILILDGADFKTRNVPRYKGEYYIMIKGSVLKADITVLDVYVPNSRMSLYFRQKLLVCKGQ